ncbi:hypothetical protein AAES_168858 [Amazona aestiva]|uniref:Uncharacterized protein n=1 Tax=Amazona aestiva TaxID=12930 RepID=A0A0Q3LS25_AMAAE|nr:hypothetical protein AAES_168858 [Amazona aestiva]
MYTAGLAPFYASNFSLCGMDEERGFAPSISCSQGQRRFAALRCVFAFALGHGRGSSSSVSALLKCNSL